MAIDQFQVTRNPFQPANTTQTTTGTSSTGSSGTSQSLPADINPYNVNVVNELMRRGRADVAAEKYPYEYKAMFGEQAAPTNKVKIYNAATEKESDLEIDPTLAHKYNTTAWGGGQPRYNAAVMNNYKLDGELGNKIAQRVDYNQTGGINGSKTKDGYKFFDKEALLPSLFYKRLGLLPEQVLALNHFDREEIARKLLTEYYNATDDGERSQFGDLESWTDYVLKHYGFDLGSQADDSGWTTLKQTAGRMWDGAVDQVDNWIDGAKALVSGFDADEAEKARIKARQAEHEKNKTAAERAITQRLDSLMADDRWEDALWFAVSNSEAWSALMGSSMGSMVADALATTGLIWTGSALAAPFTAGGSVAAGAAGTAANVSRLAMKLRSMAKAGTFGAVSSLGMVGQEAKELVLDGKTIPEGSELHNQLRLYGLLNIPLMMLPGSMETAIAKIIASKTGAAAAQELAPTLAARIRDALVKKGYTFTENGVKRSIRGRAVEWGVTPAYKVGVEAGQEWVQGAYGDALKQGADKDGNFDWDKVDTAKAFDNTKMEALGGAMFGIANAGGGAAKAKLGRGREIALGRTAHNFDQYTASLDQDTIDQINADIAAGKYRLDGTERQEGDPMPTPEDAERIRTAVLWRKFQTGDRQDTTADVDEDVDTDVNDDPVDDANPLQPSQEERNAAYAKKKTDRWARTQAYIVNQEGLKDFYANASAVKDIRGLSTEDVDSHWTEVQSALSTVAKNERKKLDKLKKTVDDAQDLVDKTDGHPNQHIYIDKLTEAQNAYNEAANAVVGIETALLRAKTSQDVAAIIDTYGNRLSGKTAQKAAQLRSLADLAAQYGTVRDNATRWNVNERQQVTDIANQIAQEAGIADFTMDPTNLSAGLNDLSAKLRSHNLADSARYQRYIEKAKVLSVMVKANRPEMLANWGKIDGHVKKKPGIRNALWQGKDNQFAWARSDVKKAIKTATVNKANVFTAEDLKAFDDIMDDLYESHPIDAFDQIIAKMQTAFNNRISESDNVQNIDERRAMLGAIQRVRYVRALVAGGSGQTATAKPSNRYGQVQLGRKVYDDLAALMHFEEVNRYAVDVAAIAEAYGVKDLGKTFEADMASYIGLLRSAVRTQYQMKNHTNANNKYVITDILRTKDGILNRGNELGATVDEYLKGVQTRLEQLRAGYFADPAPEITAYPYGDLLNAVLEDQRSPANKAVFNWVKDQFRKRNEAAPDVNDGNIDDVLDDILKKKAGTPVSEPPPSTPKGEQLISDLGEPESGYFRITENGPFVLSSQSAMNILNTAMANGSSPEDVSKFVAEQLADIAANHPDTLPPEVAKAISAHFSDMAALQTWMEANRLNQNIKADVNAEYVGALNNLVLQNVLRSEDTWMGDELGSLFRAIAQNIGVTIKGDHNGLVANMVKQFVVSGGMDNYAIYVVDDAVDHGGVLVTDDTIQIDISHPDVGGLLTKGIVQAATRKRMEDGIRSVKQTALVGDPVGERLTKRVDTLVKRFADGKNDKIAAELIKLGVLNPERNGLTADGEIILLKRGMQFEVWFATDPTSEAIRFALKDIIGPKNVGSIDGTYVAAANLVSNETKHTRQNMLFDDGYVSPVYTGFGAPVGTKGKKPVTKPNQFTKPATEPTVNTIPNNLNKAEQPYETFAKNSVATEIITKALGALGIDYDGLTIAYDRTPDKTESGGAYELDTGKVRIKTNNVNTKSAISAAVHEYGHRGVDKIIAETGLKSYVNAMVKIGEHPFIAQLRKSRIQGLYKQKGYYLNRDKAYNGWTEATYVEEILMDMLAARKTGDWQAFADRYEIDVADKGLEPFMAAAEPSIIKDFFKALKNLLDTIAGRDKVSEKDIVEYLDSILEADRLSPGYDYLKRGKNAHLDGDVKAEAMVTKPDADTKNSRKSGVDTLLKTLEGMGIDTSGINFQDGKIDGFARGTYYSQTGQIDVDINDPDADFVTVHETGHRAQDKRNDKVGLHRYVAEMHRIAGNPFVQRMLQSDKSKQYAAHDDYKYRDVEAGEGMTLASLVEEIVVDLYAARKTGKWEHFANRYGISVSDVPKEFRGLETPSIIRQFVTAIKNFVRVMVGKEEVISDADILKHLDALSKADNSIKGDEFLRKKETEESQGVRSLSLSGNPNPDNKKDRTTVYTFGYHPDNQYVTDNPTAWWDGAGWNFFYFDAQGNPQRITGMTARDVMDMAKGMDLFIDQRQKDLILKSHPVNGDAFQQFSVPMAKFWRGVNRVFRGDENNIHPVVRGMMGLVQKIAIEQHGADQFLKMAENVITHVTGTDKEGVLTNLVNRYRSQINHQLTNPGVGGKMTMFDHKEKLYKLLREIGWSQDKVNNTLYAMRAADVQRELTKRQTEDPKWKGKPIDAGHDFTAFSWTDGQGKTQHDPDGTLWMSQLSDADRKIADNLRELVTKLNDSVLQIELESGRISDDYYNTYAGQFYVPLKNETDKATAFQRQSVGRYTKADDPLTHLLANHEARLRAAEQSMIYQAFMDAVEQYGLTGFATFNSSTLRNKGDGEYAMTADGFLEGNSVTFYRNGKKVNMTITHPAMKKALQKRKKEAQSEYLNTVAKLTGFLGLTRTALPTFAKTAFLRDFVLAQANVQAAFRGKENLSTAEWFALGTKTAIRMVKSLPMIAHAKWDNQKGDFAYKVYRSEGGIGNTTAYDIDSVNAALERDVFDHASVKGKAKGYARKYLNALHASDDAARYALWISYLEKKNGGAFASEQDLVNYLKANEDIADNARNASKNITGNFEQRGMSRSIRSHYIFWNAAMAGSRTFYGLLNPRYGTYGLTAMSVLASLIFAAAAGGEDDEDGKNKESRVKNLGNVISIGGFDLGLAQELRPVAHLAQAVAFSADGTWDMKQAMTHILNGVSQAVVPVSPASTGDAQTDLLYAMTPTVLQPLVLQNAGKTYFGGDLAPAPYDTDGNQWRDAPDYLRAQSGSSGLATGAAEWLHSITGGNVDVAPGSIDMWMQQVFGSVFSQAKDIAKRVNKGENYAEAVFNQFAKSHNHEYNEFALKEEVTDRFKRAFENNRIGEDGQILGKTQFTAAYTELKALESAMSKELKQYVGDNGAKITDLYTQLNNVKNSSSYSPDEFYRLTSQIERIRGERNAVYGKYNRILMEMGY